MAQNLKPEHLNIEKKIWFGVLNGIFAVIAIFFIKGFFDNVYLTAFSIPVVLTATMFFGRSSIEEEILLGIVSASTYALILNSITWFASEIFSLKDILFNLAIVIPISLGIGIYKSRPKITGVILLLFLWSISCIISYSYVTIISVETLQKLTNTRLLDLLNGFNNFFKPT